VLEKAKFLLDAPPYPLVFVIGIPAASDGAAVRFAEIKHLVAAWMKDGVKGEIVVPALGPATCLMMGVPPVENDAFVVHGSIFKEPRRGRD
jgi:hypothetical protein